MLLTAFVSLCANLADDLHHHGFAGRSPDGYPRRPRHFWLGSPTVALELAGPCSRTGLVFIMLGFGGFGGLINIGVTA